MLDTDNFPQERRRETRFYGLFPLLVRVKHVEEQYTKTHTVADNVSSGGLYFQIPRALTPGIRILALIHLPKGLRIAALGQILRIEAKPGGMAGYAIRFLRTRIIPLSSR